MSVEEILESQWHPTKNLPLTFHSLSKGSRAKVWWKCEKGHEWEAVFKDRFKNNNPTCVFCSGKRVLKGFNDLGTLFPDLAAQWHESKNTLTAFELTSYSNKKVWWRCKEGHEWEARVASRTKGQGCPYCGNKKVLVGYNDLKTLHPAIAVEWHPTRNALLPTEVTSGSWVKVWWRCEKDKDHEWETTVRERAVNGTGCPFCSNKRVTSTNNLAIKHPHLIAEWSDKNIISPTEVTPGADIKVWWECSKGHEWETWVYARTSSLPRGCPECAKNMFASQAEKTIISYLKESLGENTKILANNWSVLKTTELDIYIPSHNLAIEYHGLYWHSEQAGKGRTYHYDKWLRCKEQGIQLIQIWEDDWKCNPELIKRMLNHKLGASEDRKVFARRTVVTVIDKSEAESFLRKNHIQGFSAGSYYLGLRELGTEELVAVLVLKKEAETNGKTLNIIRYATSVNVVGGFTKLLKHTEKTYKPEKLITFADHCVSDGGLYEKNGFIADKELPPDYMYVVRGERKHKFGYRLKKFRDDPNLLWEEGLTERELALLNGLSRIWDAGKTRWVKHL